MIELMIKNQRTFGSFAHHHHHHPDELDLVCANSKRVNWRRLAFYLFYCSSIVFNYFQLCIQPTTRDELSKREKKQQKKEEEGDEELKFKCRQQQQQQQQR